MPTGAHSGLSTRARYLVAYPCTVPHQPVECPSGGFAPRVPPVGTTLTGLRPTEGLRPPGAPRWEGPDGTAPPEGLRPRVPPEGLRPRVPPEGLRPRVPPEGL